MQWRFLAIALIIIISICFIPLYKLERVYQNDQGIIMTQLDDGTSCYFEPTKNTFTVNNVTIQNVYEVNISKRKNKIIYTKVQENKQPEVYIVNGQEHEKVTNDNFIKFNPVINDRGDYAYALSEYSVAESKIYLNGKLIKETDNNGLYKSLEINDYYLLFAYHRFDDDKQYIVSYSLDNGEIYYIPIDAYVEKIKFFNDEMAIIQGYNISNASTDIYILDMRTKEISLLYHSPQVEIIQEVHYDDYFIVAQVSGDANARYLFNAYYSLMNYQFSNPFSHSNDFLGRLSWNQSYRLESMIEIYCLTKDPLFKTQINYVVRNLMNRTNGKQDDIHGDFNPEYLWASKKYSIDQKTPISLLVDNARIFYPMLLAINYDLIEDEQLSRNIIANAEKMFSYYEKYYDNDRKMYRFPYGIAFWADGVWLPYNQQNIFGLMLIELYKATHKGKYKLRVFELAQRFASEFVYTAGERLLWHYWPSEYYAGWSKDDQISINTPYKEKTTDNLYEDLSHAGENVKFMLEFRKAFGDGIFSNKHLKQLSNTITHFMYDRNKFSRFMSGDTTYQQPSARFMPSYGWSELGHKKLNQLYLNLVPMVYPDFESQSNTLAYLNSIDELDPDEKIVVQSYVMDGKNNIEIRDKEFTMDEIKNYFYQMDQ